MNVSQPLFMDFGERKSEAYRMYLILDNELVWVPNGLQIQKDVFLCLKMLASPGGG